MTEAPKRSPESGGSPPLVRILHLEDDPNDALLVRAALENEGFGCEILRVDARDGFEAALEAGDFDVVLSDYALPSFDGVSALKIVREKRPDLPFVFVSGTMGEELAIETLKSGATDYVLKDRLGRLASSIRRALADAKARTERSQNELERRQAELALRASEERYRSIAEATNEWIWSVAADGQIQYSNRTVEAMLGYAPEELLGKSFFELVHPDDVAPARKILSASVTTSKGWTAFPVRCRHQDGTYRHLESNAAPVQGPAGEVLGFQGANRDVTERLSLEAQLRQSQKMEAIGTLAGGIAHDFNNLLTTILGYSQVLLQELGPEGTLSSQINEIRKAGERAADLTRQLLAFSRKQILQPVVLDVGAVVRDTEKMLNRLIGEDIEIVLSVDDSASLVKADPGQLEQIVMNLVVNARDAMPRGGRLTIQTRNCEIGAVRMRATPGLRQGPHVCLSITDTGTGMDRETLSHIFEPFFTTKEKGKGTGLGLSTVYGIVKQSGGYIQADSEPGKGTTFTIYIPRVAEGPEEEKPRSTSGSTRGSETILLVEDEMAVRGLALKVLEMSGYVVLEASSAEAAIPMAADYPGEIDLMVTDMVMPGASGPELAQELAPSRPEMKVLFVSGYTDDVVLRSGRLTSNQTFLQKPFGPDIFLRKVRDVLDGKRESREVAVFRG